MTANRDLWVFGYGSLIYRPAFPFAERHVGQVHGWARRFWQGSPDHRGTPDQPGRVATVIREPDARLWGMAYRVEPLHVAEVLTNLDHREQGGYARHDVLVHLGDREVTALMYVAPPDNPHFLGDAPLDEMAQQVLRSRGPSGPNVDYVFDLAQALRSMPVEEDPAFDLAAHVYVMMRDAS